MPCSFYPTPLEHPTPLRKDEPTAGNIWPGKTTPQSSWGVLTPRKHQALWGRHTERGSDDAAPAQQQSWQIPGCPLFGAPPVPARLSCASSADGLCWAQESTLKGSKAAAQPQFLLEEGTRDAHSCLVWEIWPSCMTLRVWAGSCVLTPHPQPAPAPVGQPLPAPRCWGCSRG